MLDITKKENKPIIFIIAITIILILFIGIVINEPEIRKREEYREKQRIKWENEFIKNNIKSFSVVISNDDINLYRTGNHGLEYGKVKRFYINDQQSIPDKLVNYKDFFIYHCGNWFFMYSSRNSYGGGDSIVYKFSPYHKPYKYTYNKYKRLENKGVVIPYGGYLKKYKNKLPKCWD